MQTPHLKYPHRAHRRRRIRRVWSPVAAIALLAPLAACGDDSPVAEQPPAPDTTTPGDTAPPATTTPGDSAPPATTAPATTTPGDSTSPDTTAPGDGYEHPTGADEVVLEIGYEGGFMMQADHFRRVPMLLVAGDGRAFTEGPQIAIFPPPLLPNVLVQQLDDDTVQRLLTLADQHGLFADREYERNDQIADAPDTVVRVSVGGETYEHRAYALGISGDSDEVGARGELQDFIEAAMEITTDPAAETFAPDTYLIRAFPVDDLTGYDPEPTVAVWPEGTDVELSAATDCAEVSADAVGDVFADANQLTFFTDAEPTPTTTGTSDPQPVVYQVAVKPQLPGSDC